MIDFTETSVPVSDNPKLQQFININGVSIFERIID